MVKRTWPIHPGPFFPTTQESSRSHYLVYNSKQQNISCFPHFLSATPPAAPSEHFRVFNKKISRRSSTSGKKKKSLKHSGNLERGSANALQHGEYVSCTCIHHVVSGIALPHMGVQHSTVQTRCNTNNQRTHQANRKRERVCVYVCVRISKINTKEMIRKKKQKNILFLDRQTHLTSPTCSLIHTHPHTKSRPAFQVVVKTTKMKKRGGGDHDLALQQGSAHRHHVSGVLFSFLRCSTLVTVMVTVTKYTPTYIHTYIVHRHSAYMYIYALSKRNPP